jgi:hypothetical protein
MNRPSGESGAEIGFIDAGPSFDRRAERREPIGGYSGSKAATAQGGPAEVVEPRSSFPAPPRHRVAAPAERYALREYLNIVLAHAREVEQCAADDDPLCQAAAAIALTDTLHQLWALRHLRSDDWATIVNFLQAVTSHQEFETLTHEQCTGLRLVIERHLSPDVDGDDVGAAIVLLERAGFNPWRGIAERGEN